MVPRKGSTSRWTRRESTLLRRSARFGSRLVVAARRNRPAFDLTGALTYLDPQIGIELSVAPGITFNWRNPATDYTTGTEFHVEWSASKFLTKDLSIGLIGYHYQQLTEDTGPGNRIGPFKGRVTALGGTVGYTFQVGGIPISTRLKVFQEFNTKNRLEGTAAYLTVSLPLWVSKAAGDAK
jgi:hypothetical protein